MIYLKKKQLLKIFTEQLKTTHQKVCHRFRNEVEQCKKGSLNMEMDVWQNAFSSYNMSNENKIYFKILHRIMHYIKILHPLLNVNQKI